MIRAHIQGISETQLLRTEFLIYIFWELVSAQMSHTNLSTCQIVTLTNTDSMSIGALEINLD